MKTVETDLLTCPIPPGATDGVERNVAPVDVVVDIVPVQRHRTLQSAQRNDNVRPIVSVEWNSSDVSTSREQQEVAEIWNIRNQASSG